MKASELINYCENLGSHCNENVCKYFHNECEEFERHYKYYPFELPTKLFKDDKEL